jgi:hypothetical protein
LGSLHAAKLFGLALVIAAIGCSSDKTSTGEQTAPTSAGGTKAPPGSPGSSTGGTSTPASPTSSGGTGTTTSGKATGGTTATSGGRGGSTITSGTGGASGVSAAVSGNGGNSGASAGMSGGGGMSGGAADDEDAGVMCTPLKMPLDFSGLDKCPASLCPAQDSVCFPTQALKSMVSQDTIDQLAKCDDQKTCVPLELASQGGREILTKCKSLNDAEGRCISPCVPQVAQQAKLLPKDICTGTDLCAPCYDPRTGEDTKACSQGCDKGPTEPPKPFDKCCSDRGLCVPPALAGDQAKNLDKLTCTGDNVCAPKELTDPTIIPKTCNSIDGAEGRCLSTCIGGAVGKQKDRLPTEGCGQDEVCAPCYDPVTGDETGACSVNGDKPAKPKQVFAQCCGTGVGVCVPPALAGDQADILRQESCASGRVCAPIKKAQDPSFKFATCNSLLGTGACVEKCILDPTQAAILTRSGCAGANELCAPCDLLGMPTKACE